MNNSTQSTFTELTEAFRAYLSRSGRSSSDVEAELERTLRAIEEKAAGVSELWLPKQADARAHLYALKSSLVQAARDYVSGGAPIIKYLVSSQTTTIDLAKELYLDPGRALEIERLNGVRDPLNIPPGTELLIHAY